MKIEITERDAANIAQLAADARWASVEKVFEELNTSAANQFSDPARASDHGALAWQAGVMGAVVMLRDRIAQLREEHLERLKAAAGQ